MRRRLAAVFVVLLAASSLVGSASARDVEPTQFTFYSWVDAISPPEAISGSPLVTDQVVLLTAAFGQGSAILERRYNPSTMRGTVSGTISAGAADWNYGELRGTITSEGMSGSFTIRRLLEFGGSYRLVGTWSASGHPVEPTYDNQMPPYFIEFDGVIIGPFDH